MHDTGGRQVHQGQSRIRHVGDRDDAEAVVGDDRVNVDLDVVRARIEDEHLVFIRGTLIREGGWGIVDADHQHRHQGGHGSGRQAVRDDKGERVDPPFIAGEGLKRAGRAGIVGDEIGIQRHGCLIAARGSRRHNIQDIQPVDVRIVCQGRRSGDIQGGVLVGDEEILKRQRSGEGPAKIAREKVSPARGSRRRRQPVHQVQAPGQHLVQRIGDGDERIQYRKRVGVGIPNRRIVQPGNLDIHRTQTDRAVPVFHGIPEPVDIHFALGQAVEKCRHGGLVDEVILPWVRPQGQSDSGPGGRGGVVPVCLVQDRPHSLNRMIARIVVRDRERIRVHDRDRMVAVVGGVAAIVGDQHAGSGGQPVSGGMHGDRHGALDAGVIQDRVNIAQDPDDPQCFPGVIRVDIRVVGQDVLQRPIRRRDRVARERQRRSRQFGTNHHADGGGLGDIRDEIRNGNGRIVDANDPDRDGRLAAGRGHSRRSGHPAAARRGHPIVQHGDFKRIFVENRDDKRAVIGGHRGPREGHLIPGGQAMPGGGDRRVRARHTVGFHRPGTDVDDLVMEGIHDFHPRRQLLQQEGGPRVKQDPGAAQRHRGGIHDDRGAEHGVRDGRVSASRSGRGAHIHDDEPVVAVAVKVVGQNVQRGKVVLGGGERIRESQGLSVVLSERRARGVLAGRFREGRDVNGGIHAAEGARQDEAVRNEGESAELRRKGDRVVADVHDVGSGLGIHEYAQIGLTRDGFLFPADADGDVAPAFQRGGPGGKRRTNHGSRVQRARHREG